ncbi:FecCD family ABC transporter permease [Caldisalinibacter kiritimatiensis]|uniref:Vitamin B12 ABC transporter, permease component BtuC n=1 Tax=Caldisalinibacter kiritimatiensis TaxID=1304284 RepID=R1CMI1_9FIRM|nr:iron chelate uptake ABC transporter family permease subunit [Caldisalinibacter kiritimatiensis]EOC99910.1 Vitamin B12 ABC transporter, permease component BtuC [Caldisalinibacter kiritimatiensis]
MEINRRQRWSITIIILVALLFFSIALFSTIGSADISILETLKIVGSRIPVVKDTIDLKGIPDSHLTIILKVRIPRILLGVLVGAALSSVGAAFQGIFKNPMADPYVIGISSGAALGAAIAIIIKSKLSLLGFSSVSMGAYIGAIVSTFLVFFISRVKNRVPVTTLLLSGIAVGQFLTAIMSFLMVIYSKDLTKIIYWTLGSFAGKSWNQLIPVALPIMISIVVLNFFARDLNVMLTGEESAKNMGIEVEKVKVIILFICAFTTAMAVSVSGIIGFVGLIIPHIVRLIVGPDHRILIPASALVGGIFMTYADTIARTIISPIEIPVGIITALFGGPFFIYLLRKKKRTS